MENTANDIVGSPVTRNIFVCPQCKGSLVNEENQYFYCQPCSARFSIYRGIPDFRSSKKEFVLSEEEQSKILVLLENYDRVTFEELLGLRFGFTKEKMPKGLWASHLAHELRYREKGEARRFKIDYILSSGEWHVAKKARFLEVGCGTGTIIPWVMKGFDQGIGVDISIIDLLVGQKFFEENGISNVKLAGAFAEQLPFKSETIDLMNASDAFEHMVGEQESFLVEAERVLRRGGILYFNSPNRYNIFGPEPHVNVWFVGFVPRKFMENYIRIFKDVSYRSVHLVSYFELKHMVQKIWGETFRISGPFINVATEQPSLKGKIVKAHPWLLDLVNNVFLYFTTDYQVVVSKPER